MERGNISWTSYVSGPPFKVAGAYLCQNSRTGMVNYTAVRDILHKHFSESQNKTSRACQRRLNYMLKNDTTADNVRLFLADVQRDATVRKEPCGQAPDGRNGLVVGSGEGHDWQKVGT